MKVLSSSGVTSASRRGSRSRVFLDLAEESGLDFVHFNGMSGEFYFPEMTGQGGAFLDFDNDGDLDVYLVQGAMLGPSKTIDDASFPPPKGSPTGDRLFRNDLDSEADNRLRFTDVTEAAGIEALGYGMGAAAGDVDNDGWTDLYVTNFGSNQLFRNNGNGTFADVTAEAGVDDPRWSTSAAFLDYDRDGWLDLFVTNYVRYDLRANKRCYAPSSAQDYCGPSDFAPEPDRLFRNRGDGSFEDVTDRIFRSREFGPGLGVVSADFNADGWPDLYVANDGAPNQMWIQRDGGFENQALLGGTGLNWMGKAEASMGVDAGDFDGDGDEDLFMTHLTDETNTLYVNDGSGVFEDRTLQSGLGAPSLAMTAFGTGWLDYDNDGWLDLIVVNGAVRTLEVLARQGDLYPLDQPNQLFRNSGEGRFTDVTKDAGAAFEQAEVSRGAALGDVDNDGDLDVLVTNNNGRVRLLVNQVGSDNHWLGLRLIGDAAPRDMLGGRVEVIRADGLALWRRIRTDGSYCSSNDPRVVFGLGETKEASRVRVHWPSGRIEEWEGLSFDRYVTLREGSGQNGR